MRKLCFLLVLFLTLGGCRFTVSAEKLGLHVAIDQAAYLSDEDPTTYTDAPTADPDPVE